MKFDHKDKAGIVYLVVNIIIAALFTALSASSIVPLLFALFAFIIIYQIAAGDFNSVQICTVLTFALIGSQIRLHTPIGEIYYYYVPVCFYVIYALAEAIKGHAGLSVPAIKHITPRRMAFLAAALAAYITLCFLLSRNKGQALDMLKYHLLMVVLFCIFFAAVQDSRRRVILLRISKFLLAGILLIGFLEFLKIDLHMIDKYNSTPGLQVLPEYYSHIPSVFFYNQNNYAVVLFLSLVMLIVELAYSTSRKQVCVNILFMLMALLQFIVIMSRISVYAFYILLAFGILLLVFKAVFSKGGSRRRILLRFAACAVAAVIVIAGYTFLLKGLQVIPDVTKLDEMSSDVLQDAGTDINSARVRQQLIVNTVRGVAAEGNYLGFGPGNTLEYLKTCKDSNLTNGIFNVHSAWIELLGDYGIPAFLAMMLFIGWRFVASFKSFIKCDDIKRQFALLLLIPAIFVSAFIPSSVVNFPAFTILFSVIMGGSFIDKPAEADKR